MLIFLLAFFSTLKIEAVCPSEILVTISRRTCCRIPKDNNQFYSEDEGNIYLRKLVPKSIWRRNSEDQDDSYTENGVRIYLRNVDNRPSYKVSRPRTYNYLHSEDVGSMFTETLVNLHNVPNYTES